MIEGRVTQYEVVAIVPPLVSFTDPGEPKPESRVEVRHDPIYKITEMS
jgi:hypothetical protein